MAKRSNPAPTAATGPSPSAGLDDAQRCVLAFAVEDNVDSAYFDGEHVFPLRLPFTDNRKGKNYFVELRRMLKSSIEKLISASGRQKDLAGFIGTLNVIVVSTPGVIENNDALLQLPLWNWPATLVTPEVTWTHEGETRRHFSFRNEICDIFEEVADALLTERLRSQLYARIFVVNDVTAAAVYEYFLRSSAGHHDDFVYVKAHHGINAGVVEKDPAQTPQESERRAASALKIRTTHPEAGHFLPIVHDFDIEKDFPGTCRFHGSCLEGMVSTHSFYLRAKHFPDERISSWSRFISQLEAEGVSDEEISERLIDRIVGNTNARFHGLGVDLIATYVAQLVHRLAIGTLAPERIVLGGRMISPAVLSAIRQKIAGWTNGYPLWEKLNAGIGQFIVARSAKPEEEDVADLVGAFILAQARSGVAFEKWQTLSKAQLLPNIGLNQRSGGVVIKLTKEMIRKYSTKENKSQVDDAKPEDLN